MVWTWKKDTTTFRKRHIVQDRVSLNEDQVIRDHAGDMSFANAVEHLDSKENCLIAAKMERQNCLTYKNTLLNSAMAMKGRTFKKYNSVFS